MNLRVYEGLPVQARLGVGSTNGPALLTFASPTKTQSSLRRPVSLLSLQFPAWRLSAGGSLGRRTPLMGLSKFAPPSASVRGVHSWRRRCSEELLCGLSPRGPSVQRGSAFGPEMPLSRLVPPLSFLPTSAACSTLHLSGLLRPETDHGVRHVSGVRVRGPALPGSFGSSRCLRGLVQPRITRMRWLVGASTRSVRLRGVFVVVSGRLLPNSISLGLSRWRHTLRSFPLHSSCSASVAPSGRAPFAFSSPVGPERVRLAVRGPTFRCGSPLALPSRR